MREEQLWLPRCAVSTNFDKWSTNIGRLVGRSVGKMLSHANDCDVSKQMK